MRERSRKRGREKGRKRRRRKRERERAREGQTERKKKREGERDRKKKKDTGFINVTKTYILVLLSFRGFERFVDPFFGIERILGKRGYILKTSILRLGTDYTKKILPRL